MTPTDSLDPLRTLLLSLPNVTTRRQFGNEAYFAGPTMFAALTEQSVLLRLPPGALTEALRGGYARPVLPTLVSSMNRMVEISLSAVSPDTLERLVRSACDAAGHARGGQHKRPLPARRRKRTVNDKR